MVSRALLAVTTVVVLGACETPMAHITYEPANAGAQSCGSSSCADVKIPCDAVISMRILSPDDPTAPYVSICEQLPVNPKKDLCAISQVDLGEETLELPKKTLEVQILIWSRDEVTNPVTGELDCGRHDVAFDAVGGFPVSQHPSPAIGGHAYYHPGDEETKVVLGCTDLFAIQACSIDTSLDVTATVENFENLGVLVSVNEGSRFNVGVGEPKLEGTDTVYSLRPEKTRSLDLTVVGVVPIWRGNVDLDFVEYACVQVLEDSAQATAAVKCTDENIPPPTNNVELRGVQFPKATLDQVLGALNLIQFPPNGLTVGIVVDSLFNPVANQTVMAPGGTVRYLSADRTTVSGTMTSTSGIFVSLDAPFGTRFSVPGSTEQVGGQIQGKVTVVVIEK